MKKLSIILLLVACFSCVTQEREAETQIEVKSTGVFDLEVIYNNKR